MGLRHLVVTVCLAFSVIAFASDHPVILPPALKAGDTVGLISSGFRVGHHRDIQSAVERLKMLHLQVILGDSVFQKDGYFAGTDKLRAKDINAMFANDKVKAIFELRGGWGSERTLEYVDFALIQKNPKIIIGFSDITSLLLAIYSKTGLITFHGPMPAAYDWPDFTTRYMKEILFESKAVTLQNPSDNPTVTIYPGKARGHSIGGNLSVLTSLIGSPYLPDFKNKILFIEEVGEEAYKIDRMLTQLKEAGILRQLNGIIFGTCSHCKTETTAGSTPLSVILKHYITPLGIPAYSGAMIGHQSMIFTVPEGILVEMDADKGTMTLLEGAVKKP